MCQSLITPDIKRLVIANKKKSKGELCLCDRIPTSNATDSKTQTNDVYDYDVDADALSVNNQSKGASFVRTFIQYLNRIGEDMLANNTQQFQEPKPGVPMRMALMVFWVMMVWY